MSSHHETAERIAASALASAFSFGLTIGVIIASMAFPKAMSSIIQAAEGFWKDHILMWLDEAFRGSGWGQVAVNVVRERINGTYMLIYIACAIVGNALVGFFWREKQTVKSRVALAFVGSWMGVFLAFGLLLLNLNFPQEYGFILRIAEDVWRGFLNIMQNLGGDTNVVQAFINIARTGLNGHHYVILAFFGFLTNWLLRFVTDKIFEQNRRP